MRRSTDKSSTVFALCLLAGLLGMGYLLSHAIITFKKLDRVVTVKGLSEREVNADIVIWPIQFTVVGNDLESLYSNIESQAQKIKTFLLANAIDTDEISLASPQIIDKSAQQYGGGPVPEFRYTASQTITVYSKNVAVVRSVMGSLSNLGKEGIVLAGNDYGAITEYLFTGLNDLKPVMIEESTRNAREVAEKFAQDSASTLGKIKTATQGQFSISDRDRSNPHIKNVRVVSTVQYYLSD